MTLGSDTPRVIVPGDDLDMTSGLVLLLERVADDRAEGEIIEVHSREPSIAFDLPAWCRFAGHTYLGRAEAGEPANEARYRFRLGRAKRLALDPHLAAAADQAPERADPHSGFAPRGAQVEGGGPPYPFSLTRRDQVWADEIRELYLHAVDNQWHAGRDLPWHARHELPAPIEQAVAQVFTFLAENELSALYTPARHLPRMHPYFAEVAMFIATQLADEARHIDVFMRRARAGGAPLGASTASSQASLKTLLDQEDFTSASFLLGVLGEGTFVDLLRFIEEHAPDPLTAEISRRARTDEARHVRFAMAHVRQAVLADPDRAEALAAAAEERARRLAGISEVNPRVHEALAVLAAGSLAPGAIRAGVTAAQGLRTVMHDNRVKRLIACGFTVERAQALSAKHTPNFM
jgi:TusA-related sulfurtransferase